MIAKGRACVEDIVLALEGRISNGWVAEGRFLPSVRELGRQYGCAPLTAHRAMKKLAEKGYVQAEGRLGYRLTARHLLADEVQVRPELVAFLEEVEGYDEPLGELFEAQIAILQRAAARRGWSAVLVPYRQQSAETVQHMLSDMGATALVLQTVTRPYARDFLEKIGATGIPVIGLDQPYGVAGIDHVLRDEAQGALLATEHLLRRGHRRMGWYGPLRESPSSLRRFSGAAEALMREGVSIDGQGWRDIEGATLVETARVYLLETPRPSAVLALWQTAALALARAALELGLRPGEDVDIVGWSLEEDFEQNFAAACPELAATCATAIWSLADVGRTVLDRIEERRRQPDRPDACLLLPMRLRKPMA